jgi:hypothetical protein
MQQKARVHPGLFFLGPALPLALTCLDPWWLGLILAVANSARCEIAPHVADELRAGHKKTEAMQQKVCVLARQDEMGAPVGDFNDTGSLVRLIPGGQELKVKRSGKPMVPKYDSAQTGRRRSA